jgi:hypothetical protein
VYSMASKSNTLDKTTSQTRTNVIDRRVVQERGNQILDSLIVANDDKVVGAALGEVRAMLANMNSIPTMTVSAMEKSVKTVLDFVNKGQVGINEFGLRALETARSELRNLSDNGQHLVVLANDTVGKAMTMAERVAESQARNQAQALEILADAKSTDPADLTKSVTGMMMVFILVVLAIMQGRK